MTPITNVAVDFADEALEGFASAHAKWVTAVPGGVIRTSQPRDATVAVVTGGGTGHYPAPLGMVGPGLAHGAAVGNVFSSPSSAQIEAVARAVDRGEGVLFCFWNYAGDVMHFGRAQRNLQDSGIDCRMVVISDDVLSRPWEAAEERRGIA